MKKTFNEIPIAKLESVNTKKFEKQIKKLHSNGDKIICSNIHALLAHPLFKKTYYPSALKGYDCIKINDVKYYFAHDLVHSNLLRLIPVDGKEMLSRIKNTINNLVQELT